LVVAGTDEHQQPSQRVGATQLDFGERTQVIGRVRATVVPTITPATPCITTRALLVSTPM
jgi:hypothetical protein